MSKTILQNKNINKIVRRQVVEVMREMLSDPDFGLELRPESIKRLKKSIKSKKAGKYSCLDEVLKKYSL
jgi:signal recognition particle GTPase